MIKEPSFTIFPSFVHILTHAPAKVIEDIYLGSIRTL